MGRRRHSIRFRTSFSNTIYDVMSGRGPGGDRSLRDVFVRRGAGALLPSKLRRNSTTSSTHMSWQRRSYQLDIPPSARGAAAAATRIVRELK